MMHNQEYFRSGTVVTFNVIASRFLGSEIMYIHEHHIHAAL